MPPNNLSNLPNHWISTVSNFLHLGPNRAPAPARATFRRIVAAIFSSELLVADVPQGPVPIPKAFGQGLLSTRLWCEAHHLNDLLHSNEEKNEPRKKLLHVFRVRHPLPNSLCQQDCPMHSCHPPLHPQNHLKQVNDMAAGLARGGFDSSTARR